MLYVFSFELIRYNNINIQYIKGVLAKRKLKPENLFNIAHIVKKQPF